MGFVKYDDDLRAWVYSVSQAELERIDTKKTVSYLLGARDADVRIGDKIAITCQNICFDGKITGRRHYEDFVALPLLRRRLLWNLVGIKRAVTEILWICT